MIQGHGNGIQVVVDEVRIDDEGHGRRRMTEHPLDCLDVGAGRDSQRGGGVTIMTSSP